MEKEIYIVSAVRTAIGGMLGVYSDTSSTDLGGVVLEAAMERASKAAGPAEAVIMGCVLSAGLGQAPARQAALKAGLPVHVPCDTLNKMCGSGMESVIIAHNAITSGRYNVMLAGGMENMTRAPYLMLKGRSGYRLGNQTLYDHMFIDGLEDPYDHQSMGYYADETAKAKNISRDEQDKFAEASLRRAQDAIQTGAFIKEITPVIIQKKSGSMIVSADEIPLNLKPEKIGILKPAFSANGTVTAANSSSIADGAAALMLADRDHLTERALAKICGYACVAQDPAWFTLAPIAAIESVLTKLNWRVEDVDLFEINEAFAVVPLAAMQALDIPHEKLNVNGGACALGHPIGASGARILVTLIHALKARHLKRGIAALCIAGGEACAMAIELV
ncbi:MAG: thiolase family protein [Gammaproteobacteria bacterium]